MTVRPSTQRHPNAGRAGWFVRVAALLLVATVVRAEAPAGAAAASNGTVNFSFDQVDIRTFVKLMGEMTGRRFVIDEAVKGQISVVAPRIPSDQAYAVCLKILESAGCSVVDEGTLTRVVPLAPRFQPSAPVVGDGKPLPREGIVTRVIRLQHTSVTDLRKVLDAITGREKSGHVALLEASNHVIITDTVEAVRRFEQVIAEIDRPGAGTVSEVVFMKYVDASEFVQQYNAAATGRERTVREGVVVKPGRDLIMLASPHSNSIVMVGSGADIADVKKILALIDVESPSGRGNLHAIFLKYIGAEEASKSLNALLEKSLGKEAPKAGDRRRIAIESSPANNALLVDASPMDFQLVRTLVTELDQMPQQVMIEVMIAEVGVDDSLDVGVEMTALNLPSSVGSTVVSGGSTLSDSTEGLMNAIQNGIFPRGISVGVAHGTRLDAQGNVVASYPAAININALQKKGNVKILSCVPLVAQNNKEASVSVVKNVPILKSTISGGTGTARDIIQNIDRLDVGIKLKLTPHINPNDEVCMSLNPSIEAIIDPGPSGTQFAPTIARREVSTTVTVPSGKTIIISGLIREDRTKVVRKIPILGSIPILGVLFRHTVDATERTNLIIFVTPRVMTEAADAQAATDDWSRRTGLSTTNLPSAATGTVTGAATR
jgi:general secretion pathway protein D